MTLVLTAFAGAVGFIAAHSTDCGFRLKSRVETMVQDEVS